MQIKIKDGDAVMRPFLFLIHIFIIKVTNMDITNIIMWYKDNTDTPISVSFLRHMFDVGVMDSTKTINDLNALLLQTENSKYVKDENGKFKVKENRKSLIEKYKMEFSTFKLAKNSNRKLKLIKNSNI